MKKQTGGGVYTLVDWESKSRVLTAEEITDFKRQMDENMILVNGKLHWLISQKEIKFLTDLNDLNDDSQELYTDPVPMAIVPLKYAYFLPSSDDKYFAYDIRSLKTCLGTNAKCPLSRKPISVIDKTDIQNMYNTIFNTKYNIIELVHHILNNKLIPKLQIKFTIPNGFVIVSNTQQEKNAMLIITYLITLYIENGTLTVVNRSKDVSAEQMASRSRAGKADIGWRTWSKQLVEGELLFIYNNLLANMQREKTVITITDVPPGDIVGLQKKYLKIFKEAIIPTKSIPIYTNIDRLYTKNFAPEILFAEGFSEGPLQQGGLNKNIKNANTTITFQGVSRVVYTRDKLKVVKFDSKWTSIADFKKAVNKLAK